LTFSNRLPPRVDVNALSRAVAALRHRHIPFADLTEANPTSAGFHYPPDVLAALSDPRAVSYRPDPLGLRQARAAIACDYLRRGTPVDADTIVLSASTSESYSWLFKLLCNPGDSVLAPQPSYPLFEHLTRLEGVNLVPYELHYHGRWEIDAASLRGAPDTTRAILLVSPNNPTGSYVSARELEEVVGICEERNWALIADEVFADYALDEAAPLTDLATRAGVLAFTLGGASKSLGMPQVKLGWTVVGGPLPRREAALDALALIADTFLSVSTPVQIAAADLLTRCGSIREEIHARVRRNLDRARALIRRSPEFELLRVEGGWSAPIRVPATRPEDALVLELLERERVLVYPGYFFDFPHEAYVIVSLLPEEGLFEEALDRALRFMQS
jgi:aspartate/methionine/tyrosine aminotransferase